jgi:hypothetical protein
VLWSEHLLAEWTRVIVRENQRGAEVAARIADDVRRFLAEGEVPASAYIDLVSSMPGKDDDDHFHMAAAVAGHAAVLVTSNLADFPAEPLLELGVRVAHPDALQELLAELPERSSPRLYDLPPRSGHPR